MTEPYASVASSKLPINNSFFGISLRNKTFNSLPENTYLVDSKQDALALQYAKTYLCYVQPGTVILCVMQFQPFA